MPNNRKRLKNEWVKEFPVAIAVCDTQGVLLEVNNRSAKIFQKSGGNKLIGTQILSCHSGPDREKLEDMLRSKRTNCYTSAMDGIKTLIYQSPWFRDGTYMGFVEFIIEIPEELRHKNI